MKLFTSLIASVILTNILSVHASEETNYQQILSFSFGPISPASVAISKGSFQFSYDSDSTNTFMFGAGGATRLLWLGGALYLSENLTYTRFSGSYANSSLNSGITNNSGEAPVGLNLNLFGLDTRIIHAWEWFPVNWIIPFVELGYTYTLYSQFGTTDLNSAQGGVGNGTAAFGFRFWVNPNASVRSEDTQTQFSLPIFISLKWNRIFPNGQLLDLASSGLLFSASFGL